MITTEDLANYLGIDYADSMVSANLDMAVAAGKGYVKGAIGQEIVEALEDDADIARLKSVELAAAADFYDNRSMIADAKTKYSHVVRRMIDDFCLQLRLEMGGA